MTTAYSSPKTIKYTTINISPSWLSAEVQAQIKTLPIPLVSKEPNKFIDYDIIKINMCQKPSDADSEAYDLKIVTFEIGQPE